MRSQTRSQRLSRRTPLESIPTPLLYELLQPLTVPLQSPRARFTNWGLTFTCKPLAIFEPETYDQCAMVLELSRREGRRVRFAGIGHSPSDLACTSEYMLRTTKLNQILEVRSQMQGVDSPLYVSRLLMMTTREQVNEEKQYVVAQGGVILHALHDCLTAHGLAMSNLGSISDQTIAGVITTATHGTGISFGVLSTMVLELNLMIADGSLVTCSESERPDLFKASLCGLGATGLILSAKMKVEPAFRLRDEQDTIAFEDFIDDFDGLVNAGEHTRFWWFVQNGLVRTSVCNRTSEVRFIFTYDERGAHAISLFPLLTAIRVPNLRAAGYGRLFVDTTWSNYCCSWEYSGRGSTPGRVFSLNGLCAGNPSASTIPTRYSTSTAG